LVKLRSGWNITSQASPPRPVCSRTARGSGAKIETKPMPNLPILVRSPSLLEANRRVSWLSMIASFMPSPASSTWMTIVPSSVLPSPAGEELHPHVDRGRAGVDAVLDQLAVEIEGRAELGDEVLDRLDREVDLELGRSRGSAYWTGFMGITSPNTSNVVTLMLAVMCSAPQS
jgi:hypothetical protein